MEVRAHRRATLARDRRRKPADEVHQLAGNSTLQQFERHRPRLRDSPRVSYGANHVVSRPSPSRLPSGDSALSHAAIAGIRRCFHVWQQLLGCGRRDRLRSSPANRESPRRRSRACHGHRSRSGWEVGDFWLAAKQLTLQLHERCGRCTVSRMPTLLQPANCDLDCSSGRHGPLDAP